MRSVEKSAKSLDEAIQLALRELGCGKEDVNIEILEEPGKRLFGLLGAKVARVRVTLKEVQPAASSRLAEEAEEISRENMASEKESAGTGTFAAEEKEDLAAREDSPEEEGLLSRDHTAKFLKEVTGLMGIEAHISRKEDEESIRYDLSGPHMGSIIGRRGDTLDALQYLANIIANREKEEPRKRVLLDAEDYRKRREDTLIRLAHRLAGRVKRTGHKVVLEPMSPMERRVIHTALQDDPEVKTLSEGEEPYRRLVISPADGGARNNRGRQGYDQSGGYGDRNNRYRSGQRDQQRYGEGYTHVNGGNRPVRRSFSDWEEEKDSRSRENDGESSFTGPEDQE